jgi:predicted amidohydrolase
MAIDPNLPIPVYFQLKTLLLEEILEGRYGPDGRLPTEHQLCWLQGGGGGHLYPTESGLFAAGTELVVAPTPAGRLGMMICFEHAFPDVATALALRGAQVLVIPSAVPFGYEHLLTLRTRARAQDNQVFAVGCNLAGDGFCGRSLVADPRGEVLADGTEETGLRAVHDLAAIEREREPALRLRRPDLYRHDRR